MRPSLSWTGCRQLGSFLSSTVNINMTGTSSSSRLTPWGLKNPRSVAVDTEGGVFVMDWANHRIVRFAPGDTMNASLVWGWPFLTTTFTPPVNPPTASSFNYPRAMCFGSGGFYVADESNCRLVFYPQGQFAASRVWGKPNFVTSCNSFSG